MGDFSPLVAEEKQAAEITSITRCALQGRTPTTETGMATTLIMSMIQWNFAVKESSCCLYHCALAACIGVCERLQAQPCQHSFLPYCDEQCMTCGLLLVGGDQCIVCCLRFTSASRC